MLDGACRVKHERQQRGALGREGLVPGAEIIVNERKYGSYNDGPFAVPTLAGDARTLAQRILPGATALEFTIPSAQGKLIRLVPYQRIAHERYAMYWQVKPAEA